MKKQINEIKRMQQLAGIITEMFDNKKDYEGSIKDIGNIGKEIGAPEFSKVQDAILAKYPEVGKHDFGLTVTRNDQNEITNIKGDFSLEGFMTVVVYFNFDFQNGELVDSSFNVKDNRVK